MSAVQHLAAAIEDPSSTEREIRYLALALSRDELEQAWSDDLLTVHQVETVMALRGWTWQVPA